MLTSLLLALTPVMHWTLAEGYMEQQSCSRSEALPSSTKITTHYAPSIIACTFVCRDNPTCRAYTYSNKQCTLYWTSATSATSSAELLTCSSVENSCPKTIGSGQYSCFWFPKQSTCYCMSSASMGMWEAHDRCYTYGMKLLSVETFDENSFIRNIIRTNRVNGWCVWTSALRVGYLRFTWNSTGQAVNIDINRSSYLDDQGGQGECLLYSQRTPVEPWLWDDWYCSSTCVNMCEFTPVT